MATKLWYTDEPEIRAWYVDETELTMRPVTWLDDWGDNQVRFLVPRLTGARRLSVSDCAPVPYSANKDSIFPDAESATRRIEELVQLNG